MRLVIVLLAVSIFLLSCGHIDAKQKEFALKEKELSLKYRESAHLQIVRTDTSKQNANLEPEQKLDLPFIGTKGFETRPGTSGTGTPQRYIEIKNNGDVYFGFEQYNQSYEVSERKNHVTRDRYYAGKYKLFMKCIFKKWGNEVTYYKITKEKISEVNKNNKILTGQDCCSEFNSDKKCLCEDNFKSIK